MLDILVVDDETDIQFLFRQFFRRAIRKGEVQFRFAASGEEALGVLQEQNLSIVLVLSDINMPGMTGLQLLERIKATHPTVKVVMITAYGSEEKQTEALALGADGYLTKPVNFGDVRSIIYDLAQPD